MTAKENMLRVIRFDRPERVPSSVPVRFLRYTGSSHEGIDGSGGDSSPAGATWKDIWGVTWHKELDGVMGLPAANPLSDITKVDGFRPPDASDPRIGGPIHSADLLYDRNERFLGGVHRDTLFEQAYMLVGVEQLFVAFHEEPEAVKSLLHMITDFHLELAKQYVDAGVEWASVGDDLGQQSGLLFSRECLEQFFVPEYRRLLGFYEDRGVLVDFHSCGRVQEILDVFMDLGVDTLNPVQATANDLGVVREVTRGRMALVGAVPSHVVHEGPVERIRAEVREKIHLLGGSGGYVCCPDQGLPFPKEHVDALHEAVEEFGTYPLSP